MEDGSCPHEAGLSIAKPFPLTIAPLPRKDACHILAGAVYLERGPFACRAGQPERIVPWTRSAHRTRGMQHVMPRTRAHMGIHVFQIHPTLAYYILAVVGEYSSLLEETFALRLTRLKSCTFRLFIISY